MCIPLCSKPLRFIHLMRYSYSPLRLYFSPREFTKSKSALCFSLARIYRITLRVTASGSGNTACLPFFKRRNIIALSASTTSATVRLRSVSDRIPVVISNSAIISALPFVQYSFDFFVGKRRLYFTSRKMQKNADIFSITDLKHKY